MKTQAKARKFKLASKTALKQGLEQDHPDYWHIVAVIPQSPTSQLVTCDCKGAQNRLLCWHVKQVRTKIGEVPQFLEIDEQEVYDLYKQGKPVSEIAVEVLGAGLLYQEETINTILQEAGLVETPVLQPLDEDEAIEVENMLDELLG